MKNCIIKKVTWKCPDCTFVNIKPIDKDLYELDCDLITLICICGYTCDISIT